MFLNLTLCLMGDEIEIVGYSRVLGVHNKWSWFLCFICFKKVIKRQQKCFVLAHRFSRPRRISFGKDIRPGGEPEVDSKKGALLMPNEDHPREIVGTMGWKQTLCFPNIGFGQVYRSEIQNTRLWWKESRWVFTLCILELSRKDLRYKLQQKINKKIIKLNKNILTFIIIIIQQTLLCIQIQEVELAELKL